MSHVSMGELSRNSNEDEEDDETKFVNNGLVRWRGGLDSGIHLLFSALDFCILH